MQLYLAALKRFWCSAQLIERGGMSASPVPSQLCVTLHCRCNTATPALSVPYSLVSPPISPGP
jgi:hypothetical protein